MEIYREFASEFINLRREHPYISFDKALTTKLKNDIFVLSYLKRHGGAAHPKELSEEFMISTARMAVILNQLEEKNQVVRLHDPESNRQTIVQLTDEGAALFDSVNSEILDFTEKLFRKLGEEDTRELIRIVHKLTAAIAGEE